MNITINRGEKTTIPFTISDAANGLAGKRVTWSVAIAPDCARVLRKTSGLPGSSADITISEQTSELITGTINLTVSDFDVLTREQYSTSMWVDDGANGDSCVSAGGVDNLVICGTVPRQA